MKKYITAIATTLFISATTLAQPVLSEIEDFNIGHKMAYLSIKEHIDAGKSGSGQKWDFSKLNLTSKDIEYQQIVLPADTKYAADFPKANTVEMKNDGNMVFVEKTDKQNKVWGIVRQDTKIQYTTPYVFMQRPLTFNDSIVSECSRFYDSYGGYKGTGTTKTIADGWGTLLLPSGSYTVLRVKFEQTFNDISTSNGSAMKTTVTTTIEA